MAHSHSNASRYRERSQVPAWVWLFTGAALGAFAMFLMRLSEVQPDTVRASRSAEPSHNSPRKQAPRFDFYNLLKEPDLPVAETTPPPATEPTASTTPQHEFLLQVASFRGLEDAENLRATLILLNLAAYTEQASIRHGEVWHRVIVGPFRSKSKLAKARGILLEHRHQALVLKRQAKG